MFRNKILEEINLLRVDKVELQGKIQFNIAKTKLYRKKIAEIDKQILQLKAKLNSNIH